MLVVRPAGPADLHHLLELAILSGIDFNNLTGFTNAPRIWGVEAKVNF